MGRHFVNLTDREWAELGPDDESRRAREIQAARDKIDAIKSILTERQWDILERYHWQGQKQREIAEEPGITRSTVANTLKQLRDILEKRRGTF